MGKGEHVQAIYSTMFLNKNNHAKGNSYTFQDKLSRIKYTKSHRLISIVVLYMHKMEEQFEWE